MSALRAAISPQERAAICLDPENLLPPHVVRERLDWELEGVCRSLHSATFGEIVVAGRASCNKRLAPKVAFQLGAIGVRTMPHEGGGQAADLALIRWLETGLPRRVDHLVLASGDAGFAFTVRKLVNRGMRVTVLARRGSASLSLLRQADEVMFLGGAGISRQRGEHRER